MGLKQDLVGNWDHLNLGMQLGEHGWALRKSTADFSAHFAEGTYDGHFSSILEGYLALVACSGEVPTSRNVFTAPKAHAAILLALSDIGYLGLSEQGMWWTDKIDRVIFNIAAWHPEFCTQDDISERALEERARVVVRGLDQVMILKVRANLDAAYGTLSAHLEDHAPWYSGDHKAVAKRVIELLKEGGLASTFPAH